MATGLAATPTPAPAPAPAPAASVKQAESEKPAKPLTLQEAVEQTQEDTGGRVLAADTIRSRHGSKYRIKVLTSQGRVRVIEMSSAPGSKPDAKGANHKNKEKH